MNLTRAPMVVIVVLGLAPVVATAQVQIRVGDPDRAIYSELHEALRDGRQGGGLGRGDPADQPSGFALARGFARRSRAPAIGTAGSSPSPDSPSFGTRPTLIAR